MKSDEHWKSGVHRKFIRLGRALLGGRFVMLFWRFYVITQDHQFAASMLCLVGGSHQLREEANRRVRCWNANRRRHPLIAALGPLTYLTKPD